MILGHKLFASFLNISCDSLKLLVGSIESLITEYCLGTICGSGPEWRLSHLPLQLTWAVYPRKSGEEEGVGVTGRWA